MKFTFILLFNLIHIYSGINAANDGYTYFANILKSYKLHRDPQSWYYARVVCQQEGARLALPKNALEARIIVEYFNQTFPENLVNTVSPREFILLGFHDTFVEGEYLDLDGKPLQHYYHQWIPGDPNGRTNENCGSMKRSGDINDFPCPVPALFICEKDHSPQPAVPVVRCNRTSKICYKLHFTPKPWNLARQICSYEGGYLAIIRDRSTEEFLVQMIRDFASEIKHSNWNNHLLIGFHQFFEKGKYVTMEDKSVYSYSYVNWLNGPPVGIIADNCGAMHKSGGINFHSCSAANAFICERKDDQESPSLDERFNV